MTQLSILLVLAAFSGDPSPSPTLRPGTSIPGPLLDPCASAAANATATLTANDDEDVLNSGTTAYASNPKCTRFVADFHVLSGADPNDSHGTMTFDVAGGATSGAWEGNKAKCESLKVNVSYYKKAAGAGSFAKITSAAFKGVWADGPMFDMCNLVKTSGGDAPSGTPSAGGTETYRVAVRATLAGVVVPVTARIGFEIVPH